jgi:hypothetical protein
MGMFGDRSSNKTRKGGVPVIRAFNSFQIVTLFAAMPFIIQWIGGASFTGASAAFWIAIVAYVILFGWLCVAMFDFCHND